MLTRENKHRQKRALQLLLAWVSAATLLSAAESQTVTPIFENGPTSRRLNIVLLSEGFTSAELDTFLPEATTIVDHMFSEEPFLSYKQYFNVYAISIPSNESGADIPSENINVDTAFDATFESSGLDRLLTVSHSKVGQALLDSFPEYDIVLVVVNSTKYGGSGGTYATTSINSKAYDIAVHELGHSFGNLEDEYSTAFSRIPRESPNVTAITERDSIKWKNWFEEDTPIPTPDNATHDDLVGLFEGAMYQTADWYRPHRNSKMKSLNRPWGQVNAEHLVIRIYEDLDIASSYTPSESSISIQNTSTIEFKANEALPAHPDRLVYEWSIDGVIATFDGPLFTLDPATLKNGSYELSLHASDRTALVRSDPENLLKTSQTWTLEIDLPEDVIYETWAIRNIPAVSNRSIEIDLDGDAYTNLEEFFLGSNPLSANDENHFVKFGLKLGILQVEILKETGERNVTAYIEASWLGTQWNTLATIRGNQLTPIGETSATIDPNTGVITIRDITSVDLETTEETRSLRIKYVSE